LQLQVKTRDIQNITIKSFIRNYVNEQSLLSKVSGVKICDTHSLISQYQHFKGTCCLHLQDLNMLSENAPKLFSQGATKVVSQTNARGSGDGS
jgi:endo-1,4-beta-mannosidase